MSSDIKEIVAWPPADGSAQQDEKSPAVRETFNLAQCTIPFTTCDACQGKLREVDPPIRHVWKCTFCRSFALCDTCYSNVAQDHSTVMHAESDVSSSFFRRTLTYHEDVTIGSDYLLAASGFGDIWRRASELHATRPCLGRRKGESFVWLTFADVQARVLHTAHTLKQLLDGKHNSETKAGQPLLCSCHAGTLALVAHNSIEWVVVYLACLLLHVVVVPLDAGWSDTQIVDALATLRPTLCVMPSERSKSDIIISAATQQVVSLEQVTAADKGDFHHTPKTTRVAQAECVVSVSCTSGTTGSGPKGVVLTDEMLYQKYGQTLTLTEHELTTVVFQPLSSSTALAQFLRAFCVGGSIGLVSTPAALLEELPLIRPSVLSAPPSVWILVRSEYVALLSRESPLGMISQRGREQEAYSRVRAMLGGNIGWVSTGGAKVDTGVLEFLRACFGRGHVGEGYGTTEAGSIASDGKLLRGVEVELLDVPELGFFKTDQPYPRGELCVATKTITPGYLLLGTLAQQTMHHAQQHFVDIRGTRFYRTGDIVELQRAPRHMWGEPDSIKLLDRSKHFFKTSSGKFVSPETIEAALETACASWARAIFVSDTNPLVAVVKLCVEDAIDSHQALERLHAASHVLRTPPDELIHHVLLTRNDDGVEWFNATGKKQRHILRQASESRITNQLLMGDARMSDTSNSQAEPFVSDLDKLIALVSHVLPGSTGVERWSTWRDKSFDALGGTSLMAMQVIQTLRKTTATQHPPSAVDLLRSPSLADFVARFFSSNEVPDASSIDWHHEMHTQIEDLRATSAVASAKDQSGAVLLTGATGFLGRFVLNELMKSFPKRSIICLVRAASDEEAHQRLALLVDRDGLAAIHGDAATQVSVLACNDMARPSLGLASDVYARLVNQVSHVVHCAARVNFLLPYQDLREANVEATLELVRFCKAGQSTKHLVFVSTASTASVQHPRNATSGYVQSKLVSETHLRACLPHNSHIIWPVNIIGHSKTGAGTPPEGDHLTTLWTTLAQNRICPQVSTAFSSRRLVAVDHVAQAVVNALSGSSSIILPGPVVEVCIAHMLSGDVQQLSVEEWLVWLRKLPPTHPLARHADLLIAQTSSSHIPLSCTPQLSSSQRTWLDACLANLLRT